MDSAASHIPSPSAAWSHLAASHGDSLRADSPRAMNAPPQRPEEDAAQLRARLLRMIVDSEHSRKTAAAESSHAR